MPLRVLLCCLFMTLALPVLGQDRQTLGVGRIFSNDFIGDGHDRWRSGAYSLSILRGPAWDGSPPPQPGQLLEYRLRAEIIAPGTVSPLDRPYAGTLALALATHAALGDHDLSLGVETVVVGPQTGLFDFQTWFHDLASLPAPRGGASQLPDAVYPGAFVELAHPLHVSPTVTLRPFAEARVGAEDLVRIGAEVIIGPVGQRDLWLRDVTTGQLYRGITDRQTGLAVVAGADFARVDDSAYLPADRGFAARDSRSRARIGVHWQLGDTLSLFYGATWLSPEFQGQPQGQVLGSLTLNVTF